MKSFSGRLFTILRISGTFLIACGSSALSQVVTHPGLIDATVSLDNCGSGPVASFLTVAEGIVVGGNASAKTTPAGAQPNGCFATEVDPLLYGIGSINSISPSHRSAHYRIPVESYYGLFNCFSPPSEKLDYYPYDANATFLLAAGRKSYVLEQTRIPSVFPLPTLSTISITEIPALLEIGVKCPGGVFLPVSSASIVATLNDTTYNKANIPNTIPAGAFGSINTDQAKIENLAPGATTLHDYLLVRGNRSYSLKIDYTTGTDPYSDLYNWECTLDDTGPVPQCQKKTIIACALDTCDPGKDFPQKTGCRLGLIMGKCQMLTEDAWFLGNPTTWFPGNRTTMRAYGGPLGNSR